MWKNTKTDRVNKRRIESGRPKTTSYKVDHLGNEAERCSKKYTINRSKMRYLHHMVHHCQETIDGRKLIIFILIDRAHSIYLIYRI